MLSKFILFRWRSPESSDNHLVENSRLPGDVSLLASLYDSQCFENSKLKERILELAETSLDNDLFLLNRHQPPSIPSRPKKLKKDKEKFRLCRQQPSCLLGSPLITLQVPLPTPLRPSLLPPRKLFSSTMSTPFYIYEKKAVPSSSKNSKQ